MAVTRDGFPVRVWCWPGDTAGSALIRQVKDDMRDWCLSKVIWVADRGFTSAENRRYLQGRRQLHHRGEDPLRLRLHRAGDGPRPVRAGSGLASWFLAGGGAEVSDAQGRVLKIVSAKRLETIFGCP